MSVLLTDVYVFPDLELRVCVRGSLRFVTVIYSTDRCDDDDEEEEEEATMKK